MIKSSICISLSLSYRSSIYLLEFEEAPTEYVQWDVRKSDEGCEVADYESNDFLSFQK